MVRRGIAVCSRGPARQQYRSTCWPMPLPVKAILYPLGRKAGLSNRPAFRQSLADLASTGGGKQGQRATMESWQAGRWTGDGYANALLCLRILRTLYILCPYYLGSLATPQAHIVVKLEFRRSSASNRPHTLACRPGSILSSKMGASGPLARAYHVGQAVLGRNLISICSIGYLCKHVCKPSTSSLSKVGSGHNVPFRVHRC